jgi:hypothetical protein
MVEVAAQQDLRTRERGFGRPWTQSWIAALPLAPVWAGAGLALAHLAMGFVFVMLLGDFGRGPDRLSLLWREWGFGTLVFGLLIGYAPAALAYSQRAQLLALHDLRPALRVPESEFGALERELLRFDMRWLRAAGTIAALVTLAILLFDPGVERTRRIYDPVVLWNLWQNTLAGWLCTRTIAQELRASKLFSHVGELYAEVSIFDLRPLAPFARRGIHGALVAILMLSIFSLVLLDRGAAQVAPLIQALVVALAGVSLFLPVRGVHRCIAARKREQLDHVLAQIRNADAALFAPAAQTSGDAAARLSTLVTLRQQIDAVREWPFDVSVLVRFGAVVAIGLLSSLGQVILERIVGPFIP